MGTNPVVIKEHSEINTGKLPPQNIEAEIGVLGSMLLDKECITLAIEKLTAQSFYKGSHGKIFQAVLEVYDRDQTVDIVTITEYLSRKKQLEDVGGASYISSLITQVPTTVNINNYITITREKEVLRNLIRVSTDIVGRCYEQTEDVDHLLDYAEQKVFDIVESRVAKGDIIPFKELIKNSIETVDSLYQQKGVVIGVPTGFVDLDEKTSGFQKSDLIVIAARPSMGKTALALNIAEHVGVEAKKPVALFSLEMSKEQLVQRLLCSHARVNLQHVRRGFLSKEDWPHLVNAANKLSDAPLYIDDTPSISALELRAKARRLKANYDIQLIIVDYLQLMRSDNKRSDNRQQEISEISRSLKGLARELAVPVVVLSQLNRGAENRPEHRPLLSDLRESGAIEQDADLVILLLRKDYYNPEESPGEAEIIIAKQRNGPTGRFNLVFLKEITKFENLSERDFDD